MKKLLIVLGICVGAVNLQACPIGAADSELTFSRVMQNFGRLLVRPDSVVRKGQSQPWQLTRTEIEEALVGVQGAVSCAELSLNSPGVQLLPSAAQNLSGDALKVYRLKYNQHMGEFLAILKKYQKLFESNLNALPEQRDFKSGVLIEQQIRAKANEAHSSI